MVLPCPTTRTPDCYREIFREQAEPTTLVSILLCAFAPLRERFHPVKSFSRKAAKPQSFSEA
jgi:hypothetical protein